MARDRFITPPKVPPAPIATCRWWRRTTPAIVDGQIHSHRFAAANTAVPYVNQDADQLKAEEDFLKSGFITVDIFSASPVDAHKGETAMVRRAGEGPQAMSGFAVGEEAEQQHDVVIREVGQVAAPIDKAGAVFVPGSTARVDVVVRTRKIGHFFPAGTVDAFDVWLELEGRDADGRVIFWSGQVEDNGRGAVEPGAHFYKAYQLDAAGNQINKRNAWQARSVLYVRLIPPGAADVAHYLVRIPKDAKGPITLEAKLNYRKFSHYYTRVRIRRRTRSRSGSIAAQSRSQQPEISLYRKQHSRQRVQRN